ncbi:hypothetical protein HMPREF9625_00792 [Oribacterium parvum ACB1]|uniref:NodB homology domain-containing protein n=1 Tax=Oribacterium parvum ACB1 TaxID=796943 RepID=G9WN59_9FIRM|nr:polysaccharide deacetylase family protein [Oribacterium parvum]EHL11225.1 hypothetical protein HMPREF9625_00792 [Oribacterium parvum ACB1]EJF13636.1 polysaccharide deacetylase [Oribacterium parvum ACB8]MBF1268454.1 polysaccharide deacetylase family protein [Oribacterium parvum]
MADKRKLGSGEKKFRDRSQNHQSSNRVQNKVKRKRPLTEEEKRLLMRKRAKLKRQKEARKARIIFAFVVLFTLFMVFQVFAMAFRFLEKRREAQKGELETVVESSMETSPETEEESTEETTPENGETNAEGLVFSGGRYIDPEKPMVALTFDDGPDVQVDGILMDELEKVNGRATFFVVGQRVEKFPEDIKNTVERGHEIGNHSYDHDIHLSKKGVDYIRNEFDKTDAAVEKASGVKPALVRLPGGNYSNDVKTAVQKPLIFWTIDTEDWRSRDAEKTKNTILSNIKDGDIVLMHALYLSTAEACKTVIPELNARGYQLVTVSELIHFRGQDVAGGNGIQYKNFPPVAKETVASSVSSENLQSTTVTESSRSSTVESTASTKKKSSTNTSESSSTKTKSADTKTTKKSSTESSKKASKETTKENGNVVDSPDSSAESRNPEKAPVETSAQAPANIAGAIDADDPN